MNEPVLLIDCLWGIYIPQMWASDPNSGITGKTNLDTLQDEIEILVEGPEHEHYWEAWDYVLNHFEVTVDGISYGLYQQGDLWLCDENHNWEEEL